MCLDPRGAYTPSLRHKALSPPSIHVCVCPPRVHPSLYLMGPKTESAGRKTNLESMSSWEVKPTRSLVRERVGAESYILVSLWFNRILFVAKQASDP